MKTTACTNTIRVKYFLTIVDLIYSSRQVTLKNTSKSTLTKSHFAQIYQAFKITSTTK